MKKTTTRNVRREGNLRVNEQLKSKTNTVSASLKQVPAKVSKTKTRRYLLYALGCLVLMQIVKYVVYTFVYPGSETPSGFGFTLIIYTQIGLMLAALVLVIAASVSYLRKLNKA